MDDNDSGRVGQSEVHNAVIQIFRHVLNSENSQTRTKYWVCVRESIYLCQASSDRWVSKQSSILVSGLLRPMGVQAKLDSDCVLVSM